MKNIIELKTTNILLWILSLTFLLIISCQTEDTTNPKKNIDEMSPESGEQALEWLLEGNKRFVAGKSEHRREGISYRETLTKGQQPFATILGCSDSRVPVELLFDQGFGDLFIIRVAGNVLGPDEKGSIAYAVDHLHTPLILVLGHEGCGAVTAALSSEDEKMKEYIFLQNLLKIIEPAVQDIDPSLTNKQRVHQGVEANVKYSVNQLLSEIRQHEEFNNIVVTGAVYELDTGLVKVLD